MEVVKEVKFGTSSLGDEDDDQMSNTLITQRKHAIPHLTMKNNRNIIQCCNNTHQGVSCTSKQNESWHFGPRWC